jgi:hypothetical protein
MSFTVPLPPRTQLYHRSCSNKHTHTLTDPKSNSPEERAFKVIRNQRERELSKLLGTIVHNRDGGSRDQTKLLKYTAKLT